MRPDCETLGGACPVQDPPAKRATPPRRRTREGHVVEIDLTEGVRGVMDVPRPTMAPIGWSWCAPTLTVALQCVGRACGVGSTHQSPPGVAVSVPHSVVWECVT